MSTVFLLYMYLSPFHSHSLHNTEYSLSISLSLSTMGQKNKTDAENNITVVFKVDLHCDGCASKITRNLRAFQGVETVKVENDTGKITVTGIFDPVNVRDKLAMKTKKKVELLSPQPKKEKENEKEKEKGKEKDNKSTEKEPPVTTVVLKVPLHCQGCIDRITKIVHKTKGVHNMSIEKEKDTISVKGIMDVKALVGDLIIKLKRKVEVVPPKKEKGNDKEGESGGGDKEGGGGKKKNKGGGGGGGGEMEQGKMEYLAPPAFAFAYPYPYGNVGGVNYAPFYPENYQLHAPAPQIFSDENPNACSVM
ncbi:unnamed protein product [Lupinus luteus]|uniref:HMA domain-containing protein n=1 Tax=Lupinus luteus TaxID=3873 RepID=A0AAV1Y527_LUPLU